MLCAATQQQLQRRLCSQAVKPRTTVTLVRAMADSTKTAATELKNAGPEPKKFGVADGYLGSVVGASFGPLLRFGTGALASGYKAAFVADDGSSSSTYTLATMGGRRLKETSKVGGFKRPERPLVLYEFQGCPFCKKVREAISVLDLDVDVRPCPKGGSVWRNKVVEMGGKAQFPYLVDPNTDKQMYESDAIIQYLFSEYGDGDVPLPLRMGFFTTLTAGLALAPRAGKGSQVRANKQPAQQLVLWGYDASPFVNLVKETLSELELPYKQVTCSRGSPKRQELLDKRGHFQVPYLEDPNQGVYLFESSAIVKYVEDTYAGPNNTTEMSYPLRQLLLKNITPEVYPLFFVVGAGCFGAVWYPYHILSKHNDITINKNKPLQFEKEDGDLLLGSQTVKKYKMEVPMHEKHAYHKL